MFLPWDQLQKVSSQRKEGYDTWLIPLSKMTGSNSGRAWQGSTLQKQLRYDEQYPRPQTPKSLSTTASALSLCGR